MKHLIYPVKFLPFAQGLCGIFRYGNLLDLSFRRNGQSFHQPTELLEDRWDVIPIGQGTKTMTQVINDFENLLVDERLVIAENECFRFMAKNCIAVYDEMLGVKYSKKKSKFKIDGVIAMLMGLLLCIEENGIEHYNPVEYLDAM